MSDIYNPITFASLLRKARIDADLTLRDAAKKLKVDVGNLSKLENSRLPPPRSEKKIRELFSRLNPKFDPQLAIDLAYSFHLGSLRAEYFK